MKRLITPLAILLTLALIAALLVQERQAENFNQKTAELTHALLKSQQQAKQLTLKLANAEESQKILKTESEELRSRLQEYAKANTQPGPDSAPSPTPSEPKNAFSGMLKKMMGDPQMKKAIVQQQMMATRQYYADFIKQSGLSPQDADKLFEILGKRQEEAMEAGSRMAEGGAVTTPKDYQEEIKALLGEQRADQFKAYEKSLPDRMALGQMNQQLSSSGSPLNDSQVQSMLQIYSEERAHSPAPSFKPGSGAALNMSDEQVDEYLQQQADLNQRINVRANSLLTPQQMEKLQAAQKQMLEMQRMGMKMAKQLMGSEK